MAARKRRSQSTEGASGTDTPVTQVPPLAPEAPSIELPHFHPLPAANLLTLRLVDPRLASQADYDAWASGASVGGAIVRVLVQLTETSVFAPHEAEQALRRAGATHVRPIVPSRPERNVEAVAGLEERLPVGEAFERWLRARKALPRGLTAEGVLEEFRALQEER